MQQRYGWSDFELDESTDAVPDKYILTIWMLDENGYTDDEVATIVHRTCGGRYPLDGELANWKRENALRIVEALNLHAALAV